VGVCDSMILESIGDDQCAFVNWLLNNCVFAYDGTVNEAALKNIVNPGQYDGINTGCSFGQEDKYGLPRAVLSTSTGCNINTNLSMASRTEFTIVFLFKSQGSVRRFVGWYYNTSVVGYLAYWNYGISYYINNAPDWLQYQFDSDAATMPNNVWHCIVATYLSTTGIQLWVNGINVGGYSGALSSLGVYAPTLYFGSAGDSYSGNVYFGTMMVFSKKLDDIIIKNLSRFLMSVPFYAVGKSR
jgi:hypothetical protein